jgi:ankyrin repeat protein
MSGRRLIRRRSPVQLATILGRPEIVRALVREGADLDYVSDRGWSILHHVFAVQEETPRHSHELFKIFRSKDVQFDSVKDLEGWNALHRCAAYGTGDDIEAMVKLFGAGRFVDQHTNMGCSPVHVSAMMGNLKTLRPLLTTLADPHDLKYQGARDDDEDDGDRIPAKLLDARDASGWTPLHHSIRNRHTETMRWLLGAGADFHALTYRAAKWYPPGHDGEVFRAADVARLGGKEMVREFVEALRVVSPDAVESDGEVFWDSPAESEKSEEIESDTDGNFYGEKPVGE